MNNGGEIPFSANKDLVYVTLIGSQSNAWDRRAPIIEWLNEYEGQGSYYVGGNGIYFDQHEDAVMFKLKWV